jgi:hypothetical protein
MTRFVGGPGHTVRMSDKTHPAGSGRETAELSHAERKGAVVITGNGMPAAYEPPSGALAPAAPAAAPSAETGGGAGSAPAAPTDDGE